MAIKQGQLFDPSKVNLLDAQPDPHAIAGAQAFTGGKYSQEGLDQTHVRGSDGYTMYRTYDQHSRGPVSPETAQSYEVMRQHLGEQFGHLTKPVSEGGQGISVNVTDHDPYTSFDEMRADVINNRNLSVLSTAATGPHPIMTNEENDQFRAVHDYYGHVATGRGFDRHGEEAAYLSHRQMFPEEAHTALASETRGQNSFLNWGGGSFPDQAISNVPGWMTKPNVEAPATPKIQPSHKQGTLF